MYHQPSPYQTRSQSMETAATVLSVVCLISCSCLYISIPCGALAVILAFLSRGAAEFLSRRSMTAALVGICGIIFCVGLYIFSFYITIHTYGSISNGLRAYCEMNHLDYDAMFSGLKGIPFFQ